MKYRTYDWDGDRVSEGHVKDIEKADVPTHGSISIEILPQRWLSFTTSEWLCCYLRDNPVTHKTPFDERSQHGL